MKRGKAKKVANIDKLVYNMYTLFIMSANIENSQIVRVSSREARAKWRDLLDTIYRGVPGIIIERYGKPVAALVSFEDFEVLQQNKNTLQIKEQSVVYNTHADINNLMNDFKNKSLNELLQTLSDDALELVTAFVQMMQPQAVETAVSNTPTVTLPASALNDFFQLLPEGYEGNALGDSEALYDDV